MSTFLHYVHCKDALIDCSAPGGERCESLTWVDEIAHIILVASAITTLLQPHLEDWEPVVLSTAVLYSTETWQSAQGKSQLPRWLPETFPTSKSRVCVWFGIRILKLKYFLATVELSIVIVTSYQFHNKFISDTSIHCYWAWNSCHKNNVALRN